MTSVHTIRHATTKSALILAIKINAEKVHSVWLNNIAPTAFAQLELKETLWFRVSLDFASIMKTVLTMKLATD